MEHPMAGKSRASKAKKFAEDSKDIFDKLDEKEAEEAAKTEEPIPPKKLKSLKELLFIGSTSRTVSVDGFVFKLRSLTHQESRAVAKRIFLLSDEEKLVESNAIQLAFALESINGLSIDEAYPELFDDDGEDLSAVDKALEIVSSLNTHLTAKLIAEYFELSNESKVLLNPEEEKDALKK